MLLLNTNIYQFKFYHWSELCPPDILERMTIREAMGQYDPFNCECRAYGRLEETGRQLLASRCYGFVILGQDEEDDVVSRCSFEWNRRPAQRKLGLRCLVKELMPAGEHFQGHMLEQMRKDLIGLHTLGIVVYDLREDNYMMSKIVDFSQAHVVPHHDLDMSIAPSTAKWVIWRDLVGFDGIVSSWNKQHPTEQYDHPFMPTFAYRVKMRDKQSISKRRSEAGLQDKHLLATRYDWKGEIKLRKSIGQALKSTSTPASSTRISKPRARRKRSSKRR